MPLLRHKTMRPGNTSFAMSILLLLLIILIVEAKPMPNEPRQNAMKNSSSSLVPWLRRVAEERPTGCSYRPEICHEGKFPPKTKRLCCKNHCVDVNSDVNNCGMCGMRCPFTWQCCQGLCIDTKTNPFHCGQCDHKCKDRSKCVYGMCGYAHREPPPPPKRHEPPPPPKRHEPPRAPPPKRHEPPPPHPPKGYLPPPVMG